MGETEVYQLLQQGSTLPRAAKNRETQGCIPDKSQINSGSLATKPHRGEVQTPQPGWFAGTLGFSVPWEWGQPFLQGQPSVPAVASAQPMLVAEGG